MATVLGDLMTSCPPMTQRDEVLDSRTFCDFTERPSLEGYRPPF